MAGLREFMTKTYPRCLFESAPRHPVRLLVVLETDPDLDLAREVDAWAKAAEAEFRLMARGQRMRMLHYMRIRPVTFPTWEEVGEYIDNHLRIPPSEAVRERIEREYRRIAAHPDLTFRTLTDLLDKHLESD